MAVSAAAISVSACTGPAADDDDDGFGSPTATGSATPTPTATGTANPPQFEPPTPISSFTNGSEIWLCMRSQFDGTITNVAVDDPVSTACSDSSLGVGFTSTLDEPQVEILFLDGDAPDSPLACSTATKHWTVDYLVDGDRCTGCVNAETTFDFVPDDPFGTFCGAGGLFPISALVAHRAETTGKLRFIADILPAFGNNTVNIKTLRVYTIGNASHTSCTATANIGSGGDGTFDADCNPNLEDAPLVVGDTYNALVFGDVDGIGFMGLFPFDYEAAP